MLLHKSMALEDPNLHLSEAQAELGLWEQLVFSFEMDNESHQAPKDSRNRSTARSRPTSASAQAGSSTGVSEYPSFLIYFPPAN